MYPVKEIAEPRLSIVIPVYNEEAIIPELTRRLLALRDRLPAYEVIFVNDGSSDRTIDLLKEASALQPNVFRILDFSRNFGHQISITAGMDYACGDYVVTIDGDLQDPPELIPELLSLAQKQQLDVVYAKRRTRDGETPFKLLTAKIFYRLIRRATRMNIPENVGDFRLMSRRAADALRRMREQHRFLRGMVPWIGFKQGEYLYDRAARFAGTTKYPFSKMFLLAANALISFSFAPLRYFSYLGMLVSLLCAAFIVRNLYLYTKGNLVPGWTTIVIAICFMGGLQLIMLGVLGEYIGRLYEEAKGRPLYIVREAVNLPAEPMPDSVPAGERAAVQS